MLVLILLYPGLLAIDNAHFQYVSFLLYSSVTFVEKRFQTPFCCIFSSVLLDWPSLNLLFRTLQEQLSSISDIHKHRILLFFSRYNSISLGLFLISVLLLVNQRRLLGSIAFVLALNYKQMELYHALPIFVFILSRCLKRPVLTNLMGRFVRFPMLFLKCSVYTSSNVLKTQ